MSSVNFFGIDNSNLYLLSDYKTCLASLSTLTGDPKFVKINKLTDCLKLRFNSKNNIMVNGGYCLKINNRGQLTRVPYYTQNCSKFKKNEYLMDVDHYCFNKYGQTTSCSNSNLLFFI